MEKRLIKYVNKFNSTIQGSQEWLELRKGAVGGSEIAAAIGQSIYSDEGGIVAAKGGLIPFNGNVYTRWGQLFEEVTQKFTEIIFGTKVHETGNIPHRDTSLHRYSPDGIAIIKAMFVLLEFKSPFSSIAKGKIPKHYLPQVLAGLDTTSELPTSFGIFVSNSYRACSWVNDLRNKFDYNLNIHTSASSKFTNVEPIAYGSICFGYAKGCRSEVQELLQISDDFVDIGAIDFDFIGKLTSLYREKKIRFIVNPISLIKSTTTANLLESDIYTKYGVTDIKLYSPDHAGKTQRHYIRSFKKKYPKSALGALAWKLFDATVVEVKKQPDYIKKHTPALRRIIERSQIIKQIEDPIKKVEKLYEFYPNYQTKGKKRWSLNKIIEGVSKELVGSEDENISSCPSSSEEEESTKSEEILSSCPSSSEEEEESTKSEEILSSCPSSSEEEIKMSPKSHNKSVLRHKLQEITRTYQKNIDHLETQLSKLKLQFESAIDEIKKQL